MIQLLDAWRMAATISIFGGFGGQLQKYREHVYSSENELPNLSENALLLLSKVDKMIY